MTIHLHQKEFFWKLKKISSDEPIVKTMSSIDDINTIAMFVDEGVGSFDDNSLAQALSTLSDLSNNNRVIVIISHVSELKNMIDKKIIVTKTQKGSLVKTEV